MRRTSGFSRPPLGRNASSMTSPRPRRRPLIYTGLLLVVLYIAVSLFSGPGVVPGVPEAWTPKSIIPHRGSSGDQINIKKPAPSPNAAPGFERALPSCRVADLIDDPLVLEHGQNNIRLSRTYEGTGARIRKVLKKALRGEKIKIAVIGGSVSAGHALGRGQENEKYMYKMIHRWFLDTFPGADHQLNLDSVIPATTAWYFSYCLSETMPDDADLVLMELDINQVDPFLESLTATEALYRTVLAMPTEPALLYISTFGLTFHDMTHGWRHSALISQWLDVPEINIRNFMLPHLMAHPGEIPKLFSNWANDIDARHINEDGHRLAANMVIAYLREQLCLLQREGPVDMIATSNLVPSNDIVGRLPRLGMLQLWDEHSSVPILHPKCQSITSTKFPLRPIRADGWKAVDRNDKRSYEATVPGSEIAFDVEVDVGLLGIFFWMTRDESFGQVECWVDDRRTPDRLRHVSSYNPLHGASTFEHSMDLWNDLEPGPHVMTCRLEEGAKGGKIFRISATVTR